MAFHAFVNLSKKLNFNAPQNPKAFSGKVNRYEGLLILPCILIANTKDIDENAREMKVEILITTYQLTPNIYNKLIDITHIVNVQMQRENLVLYIKQEEFDTLMDNKLLLQGIQKYFEVLKDYKKVFKKIFLMSRIYCIIL